MRDNRARGGLPHRPQSGRRLVPAVPAPSPRAQRIVLKARDTWPRTTKIFCHGEAWWPSDAEVVERVPVRSCVRRGAAIDLVLDRSRENRSQFVITRIRGDREAIFWQSPRTAKLARPNVRSLRPRTRVAARRVRDPVDSHERYAWKFTQQQVATRIAPLAGRLRRPHRRATGCLRRAQVACRPGLDPDLGRLTFVLADLAASRMPQSSSRRATPRCSKLDRVRHRSCWRASRSAPCGSRRCRSTSPRLGPWHRSGPSASWAPRWRDRLSHEADGPIGSLVPAAIPEAREVRAWAVARGIPVSAKGRVPAEVTAAFLRDRAQPATPSD